MPAKPKPPRVRNGVPLFTPNPGATPPDLALVNRLRDDKPQPIRSPAKADIPVVKH